MQNVIRTATGYRATIDGREWTIPNDPGNRFWQSVQDAIAGGAAVSDEVVLPQTVTQITFAQLLIGLVAEGLITEVEGDAWLAGTIPLSVSMLIGTLPKAQQFAAKARAIRPSAVVRNDNLVIALAQSRGMSASALDAFFAKYAGV
jgi:hypothetical protein